MIIRSWEGIVRQHIGRWLGVGLWLVPTMAICSWVGVKALPERGAQDIGGALCSAGSSALANTQTVPQLQTKVRTSPVETVPGMPPVADPGNLYSAIASDRFAPAAAGIPARVYVPNRRSNSVSVIDPATLAITDRFPVGFSPQHIVPSWDLKTLWVANNGNRRTSGSLTPIDAKSGRPGQSIPVDDPYNLYFTPDGHSAIVVAERRQLFPLAATHRDPPKIQCRGSRQA